MVLSLTRRRVLRRPESGRDERGVVLVIVALMLSVMLVFVALAVDIGRGREVRRQAQAAADTAALAAGNDVAQASFTWSAVVSDTKIYVNKNLGVATSAWVNCADPGALSYKPDSANGDNCISADSSGAPSKVRVKVPLQSVATNFAGIIGVSALHVNAVAIGGIGGTGPCDLCVLSPSASPAMSANGNGTFNIESGGVVVDSTGCPAASLIGNATVDAAHIGGPAGPACFTTTGNATYTPTPVTQSPVPDPLASVPMCPGAGASVCPSTQQPSVSLHGNQSADLQPGIYSSISAQGNGTLTMEPGTYIITGSMVFRGNGNLVGNGVTLYFACAEYPSPCSTGESGATYDLAGNGSMTISAPTSGTFKGLSIFADRNNAGADTLVGNGSSFDGTVYEKSGNLTLQGNGQTLNSRVIVNTVSLGGNGNLTINATSDANITIHTVSLAG